MERPPEFDDVEVLGLDENEKEEELMQEIGSERRRQVLEVTGNSASKKLKVLPPQSSKGPIDCYFSPRPTVMGKNIRQTTIDENSLAKNELRERACVAIARWMYDVGIAFNAVNYDSFGEMIQAIENYGREIKPPSFHEGSVFIKSVDASDESKTAALLASLIEKELMEISLEKVVQVVKYNASNNVAAGRILEANFPHLYWTPCAAHCIDLMFEDIFKIHVFKETFRKAVELTGFIYGSSGVLNMLQKFTNGVELLRPGQTRFATAFITLGRIHLQKANIRKMFTSESWTTSKWAKEVKGKKCERTILSPAFWNHVVYALKVSGPLVRVL
ncbi:uncharacterized protein LOC131175260 [Hevea brasiliensis]|uniref:uncharacterized protein LOC131175260 n=1 Tax=Hevea brasiliensis TaxID=3981 RepID=UPI0025D54531|nr:uncharacterized protein LOC131175260 [Hevea brasiliensis]